MRTNASQKWVYMLTSVDELGKLSKADEDALRNEEKKVKRRGSQAPDGEWSNKRSNNSSRKSNIVYDPPERASEAGSGGHMIHRHSLEVVPLRDGTEGRKSRVAAVVFTDENEPETMFNADIKHALLTSLCRAKAAVTQAFAEADEMYHDKKDKRRTSAGSDSILSPQVLPYQLWLETLIKLFPSSEQLWRAYAENLLADGGVADQGADGQAMVSYMRWLDRFQVRLNFDKYGEFQRAVLKSVGQQLMIKTREMSLDSLLSYFDPNQDGVTKHNELETLLFELELGFSPPQTRQLIFELGFTDPKMMVEPIEVMSLLISQLPNRSPKPLRASTVRSACERRTDSRRASDGRRSSQEGFLMALRDALKRNQAKFAADKTLLKLFLAADEDRNGFLSYNETRTILKSLQEACSEDIVPPQEVDELIAYIDLDKSGVITYLEFIAAFGDVAPTAHDLIDDVGTGGLAVQIMQQICASLFELDHGLQKAFTHIDHDGKGYISPKDFEKALTLVASACTACQISDWQIVSGPHDPNLPPPLPSPPCSVGPDSCHPRNPRNPRPH